MVGCGKEDMTIIDKDEMLRGFRKGFQSVVETAEITHFNEKHPEYHNVYISNIKDKYGTIYDNVKGWHLISESELVDSIYKKQKYYIEDNMDDYAELLTGSQMKSLNRWLEIDDDDDPKIKKIKADLKLLLYNRRDIPIKTKEMCETK